jgi:anti-sigma factor ChrR (cupin superfamily)
MTDEPTSRICREVQSQLPAYAAGTLGRLRRRLVAAHLRRCTDCAAELERQQAVAAGLEELGEYATVADDDPPEGLLDSLLAHAEHPGMRGRAAVPVRGAVSGARPGLSVVLLLIGAAAGTTAGYVTWRVSRAVLSRITRR